jgi:hypothetical protein
MSRKLFWLTERQWGRIEPHWPKDSRGKERGDDRGVIGGIVHGPKSGWSDCSPASGPPTTIDNRFVRWAELGKSVPGAGKGRATADDRLPKAHRSAARGKGSKAGDWPLERRAHHRNTCAAIRPTPAPSCERNQAGPTEAAANGRLPSASARPDGSSGTPSAERLPANVNRE